MKLIRPLSAIILLIGIGLVACMKESRYYPESESLKILSNNGGIIEVEAKLSKKANKNFNHITEFGFIVSKSPMTINEDTIANPKDLIFSSSFSKGYLNIFDIDTSTNADNEFVFKSRIPVLLNPNTNYYIRSYTRVGNNKRSGFSDELLFTY